MNDMKSKTKSVGEKWCVEIRIYWNGEMQDVLQLVHSKKTCVNYRIGEAFECDLPVVSTWLNGLSQVVLVKIDPRNNAFVDIPRGACATLFASKPEDVRILEPQEWALRQTDRMELVLGALKFVIGWVESEIAPTERSPMSTTFPVVIVLSLLLHAVFYTLSWYTPAAPKQMSLEDIENCRIARHMLLAESDTNHVGE